MGSIELGISGLVVATLTGVAVGKTLWNFRVVHRKQWMAWAVLSVLLIALWVLVAVLQYRLVNHG